MALLWATPAFAQPAAPPANTSATLISTDTPVTLRISGYASLGIQVTGTWTGELTFQGSVDGVTYASLTCTAVATGTSATLTTVNGLWTCNVGGLATAQVLFTMEPTGSAVVSLQAALSGGGSGGGGGGGAASSVTINDPTITTQKAAVNGSGQLSITCANCSGSGASAVDNSAFVAGTTSGAPAMGFFHTPIDTVTNGDTATIAIDSKRNQFGVIRDAALNARGANVTAGNALVVDGSASTQPVSGTFWQATQPVSGTVTTSPPANASTNVAQLAGTATAVSSGLKDAGTLRVVLATDQPALTNKLLVTPDSVALPANQSVNVAQLAGTTTTVNSGLKDGGTLRVVLATDQPALTNKLLVTPDSVALPANQSVNAAQIAGANTVTAGVAGLLAVGGNIANGVAATANPVPVGGIFTTTPTTLTTGQTATLQFTAAQNAKHDLTTIAGTAPTTAGKIDVKGADGDVFVRQGTAANLNATVVGTGTFAAQVTGTVTTTPPANASTNVAQFGGVNVSTGIGASGTGIPRVTVSNDSTLTLLAGSAVIGHVIADSGSTTAVTGNVTVTQATGTNLHAVLDTTSTTAVTQATGTNLHAVIDSGSTTAVTGNVTVVQGTGTNLHAVLDTTSTTAVTQATAANLNATVVGTKTNNNAAPGATNDGVLPGLANAAAPTYTEGNQVALSTDLGGALRVAGTVTANAGTNLNTSALALSATQTDGTQKTKIVDGSGNVIAATSNALNVQCANCSGSGASAVDAASFTAGASVFAPTGGVFNDSAAALVAGTQGMARLTANRAQQVNLRDTLGQELGVQNNPEFVSDLKLAQLLALIQKQGTRLSGSFGRAISSSGDALDVNLRFADPCGTAAKASIAISQTAGTRLMSGPARRVFICSLVVVGADAENIALVEGVGTVCATNTVGVVGGTTAATGPNFAANGGFSLGGGMGAVAIGDGMDVCLLQSGSGRVAGVLTYALAN